MIFVDFAKKIWEYFRAPDSESDIVTLNSPLTNKRRLQEDPFICVECKKRKFSNSHEHDTIEPDCEIIDLEDMTIGMKRSSPRLKENNLPNKRSAKMVELALQANKPRMVAPKDTSKIYCIDDDDDENAMLKKSDIIFRSQDSAFTNANCRTRSQTNALSLNFNQDSKNFTPTMFSSRPPSFPRRTTRSLNSSLCLSKVRKEKEQKLMMQVVLDPIDQIMSQNYKKERKSLPLVNSTLHNSKLNNPTTSREPYALRSLSRSAISANNETSIPKNYLGNFNSNQTASPVFIDLTEDDDDSQRKAIEETVVSSSSIRNYKSTFLAKNRAENGLLEFDSLLRKYNNQDKQRREKLVQIEKDLKNRNAEVFVALEDIINLRLSLKDEKSEEEAEKLPHEIRPITKDMQMEMRNITASGKTPLVQIKDTAVKIQDIKTLENTAWLNDTVINAYMNLIKLRSEIYPDRYPKVYCFNTFLFEQLSRKGYNSIRRWTRKIDIFDFTILIVPIHLGNHWTLVQINFDKKFIRYYDSMGSPNNRCLEIMKSYLIEEHADKKKRNIDLADWKFINVPNNEIPQQRNVHDCGVFACTFAEYITRNARFNFDQEHMGYFRVKMMYEILTGKLLL